MVNKRFDGLATKSWITDPPGKDGGTFVAPTEFQKKTVPHMTLFVRAGSSIRVSPGQNLFISTAGKSVFADSRVGNAKKPATTPIKGEELCIAQIRDIVHGKSPRRVQTNLVQHPTEINKATDFDVRAAKTGNARHGNGCQAGKDAHWIAIQQFKTGPRPTKSASTSQHSLHGFSPSAPPAFCRVCNGMPLYQRFPKSENCIKLNARDDKRPACFSHIMLVNSHECIQKLDGSCKSSKDNQCGARFLLTSFSPP